MQKNKNTHGSTFWSKPKEDVHLDRKQDGNDYPTSKLDKDRKFSQKALGRFKKAIQEEMQEALEEIHSSNRFNQ
ncbi:hypothetical protein [Legionella waltersii]|uniref:Uncharacterized protein n=1 Tax=Legionella waltersii TaxID=66969 RepID=A0A0W1AGI4_9GAMM|nr:hypothetical protein [Legionella waltersii]KTD80485.1 hypothetical protein Lwal_1182 [Legionella waltersii]SNV09731.1 Uncharacterised protein [Legionella waltersii]